MGLGGSDRELGLCLRGGEVGAPRCPWHCGACGWLAASAGAGRRLGAGGQESQPCATRLALSLLCVWPSFLQNEKYVLGCVQLITRSVSPMGTHTLTSRDTL